MRVKTIALKNNIASLKNCLNDCDRINFEVYKNINDLNNNWKDSYTTAFFDATSKEHALMNDLVENIKKLKNIYQLIYDEYSGYGKSFEVDTSLKESTLNNFDNYVDNIEKILKIYRLIPITDYKEEAETLSKNKESFLNNKKSVIAMKGKVKKLYDSVDSLELDIAKKLNNIEIIPIEEIQFTNLEKIDIKSGKVGINEEALKILDKIDILIKEQTENFEKFNNTFKDLQLSYISNNNEKIEEIELEINNAFNNLINNHKNIILYVKSRYKEFEEAGKKIERLTEDFVSQNK